MNNALATVSKHAALSALRLMPERLKVRAARALAMTSPGAVRAIRSEVYSGTYLAHRRIGHAAVMDLIRELRQRFPEGRFFLITDLETLRPQGVRVLDDPAAADLGGGDNVFVVALESDARLSDVLRRIGRLEAPRVHYFTPPVSLPAAHYFHQNDLAKAVLLEEFALNHGKFDLLDFENLLQAAEITREIPGDYVEVGVYRGDSAHCVLNYMRRAGITRNCFFLDTFEGFTYDEAGASADRVWQDTHTDTSLEQVERFLAPFERVNCKKVNIIRGELPNEISAIALCNIDVDLHEAVLCAAHKLAARIQPGGIMVFEDAGHTPYLAGAKLAVDEFARSAAAKNFLPVYLESGQTFFIRKS